MNRNAERDAYLLIENRRLEELAVAADVADVADVDPKIIKKTVDSIIEKLKIYIILRHNKLSGWAGRSAITYAKTAAAIALQSPAIYHIPVGFEMAQTGTGKVDKTEITFKVMLTESNSSTMELNAFADPRKNTVTVTVGVPHRIIVDVGILPKPDEDELRSGLTGIIRHEISHIQRLKGMGFFRRIGHGFKRIGASIAHRAREIIRKRGLPGNAGVAYFRMQDEYEANVDGLVQVYKDLPAGARRKLTLYDLLYLFSKAFRNYTTQAAFMTAYYDDKRYRNNIAKELRKRGVKLKKTTGPSTHEIPRD